MNGEVKQCPNKEAHKDHWWYIFSDEEYHCPGRKRRSRD